MKNYIRTFLRWLALAAFILAAGCCYSCGRQEAILLPVEQEEAADRQGAADRQETAEQEKMSGQEDGDEAEADLKDAAEVSGGESAQEPESQPEPEFQSEQQSEPASCFVHVCGEVIHPGVYELQEGQRIWEAVQCAGGFTEAAAQDYLNLAEPVYDGMKLMIPDAADVPKPEWEPQAAGTAGAAGSAGTAGSSGAAGMSGNRQAGSSQGAGIAGASQGGGSAGSGQGLVDLNTAGREELMTLTGIGPSRAEDIIRYREEHGRFTCIEDVMKVSGIKEAAFQKIKDRITVSP